ncbi:ATPase family AAA domain-containing protein 5 [Lampris incognitus]|uniref:ATPase family AAA domain-containing protein 5 n=1 Tax=Lampris incognitus TaxID=2546036 RepID=UPI0024B578BC|nr:ATPase family AAA domain-containing protein 5 [Lampris incognitus]
MAGVVAMASAIEDFETQPCKKSRKDGDSPVVKTITNYFYPISKPVEKPFSPPRSSNIMDYFRRKGPPSQEKASTPEESVENFQKSQDTEKPPTQEVVLKQSSKISQKRRRPSKIARRLLKPESVSSSEEGNCQVVDEPDDGSDSAELSIRSYGIMGSDTAALLAQFSVDTCVEDSVSKGKNTGVVSVEQTQKELHEENLKSESIVKGRPEISCKRAKAAVRNARKKQPQEAKQSELEVKEAEQSLCDVHMEVSRDKGSQSNIITISFEDFLQSQKEVEGKEENSGDKGEEGVSDVIMVTEGMETDQLKFPKADEKLHSGELCPPQLSPQTLTIQAEVHTVSPKQKADKALGKIASIFKKKGADSSVEVALPPHSQVRQERQPVSTTPKRKSNVVLQEEDLELAVVESESTPKCSQSERKQFIAAFKQPSLDGAKTKPGKGQSKQKQPADAEQTSDCKDKTAEEDAVVAAEQLGAGVSEKKVAKRKPSRKGKKKAHTGVDAEVDLTAQEEPTCLNAEADVKTEEPTTTSVTSTTTVRRSRRETAIRQAPEVMAPTPVLKTRGQKKSKETALLRSSPVQMSTPKMHKSRRCMFKAELVSPADKKGSPISWSWASGASKTRKQAKKLVEKAKAIQQSKKTVVFDKTTMRRSLRSQTFSTVNYCEDEDSLICLEDDQSASPQKVSLKGKSQKSLRSLNDVLGKAAPTNSAVIFPLASKVAAIFQDKKAQRTAIAVSICDDSSQDCSENSQDDEQFRARRQFLKSGLPESFKKHIAKTAATWDAYFLSCSSFQPVVHVEQMPHNCPLRNLPWPESSFLRCLKESWCVAPSPLPSLNGSFGCKTESAPKAICERGSGWRKELSECVRELLLEEVIATNPSFPARKFLNLFLKKRAEHLQQCTASEAETVTRARGTPASAETVGGKRKRMDEGETPRKVAKRQRSNQSEENNLTPEPVKKVGRMSRATRRKLEEKEKANASVETTHLPSQDNSVIVIDDSPLERNMERGDMVKEDVLWTEKYRPQHSSDIIGNTASVLRLHSWLKEWKLRADREERRRQKEKKREEGGKYSDWELGEEDFQDGEDVLCNTLLITGPTGVGKTAAVYACAQELGFKVFEVNASSQRSGRLILSQLKEATQSHQVDIQGVNAHKPSYFNSYSSSTCTTRPGSSPRKGNSPHRIFSSPRRHPQSPKGIKKGSLAPTSLANFFKVGQPANKEPADSDKTQQSAVMKTTKEPKVTSESKELATKSPPANIYSNDTLSEEQGKKGATSLILFEEVDVIFDDDWGFLAAIKTFMTTTKRPVILTTSDPAFSTMFDGNFEEILFKTPPLLNIGSYLQLLCLAEDLRIDPQEISSMLSFNHCDVRQSLLQLQFWTRSSGGRQTVKPLTQLKNSGKEMGMTTGATDIELKPVTPAEASDNSVCEMTILTTLPPCDTGCTESMLGLLNIEPEKDIKELLRSPVQETGCWELLKESRHRGMDLLYSNMENLLPLPLTQLTILTNRPLSLMSDHSCTGPKDLPSTTSKPDSMLSHATAPQAEELAEGSDDESPVKVSNRIRKNKKRNCLPDKYLLQSDSDSEDGFLSLCKPQSASCGKEGIDVQDVKASASAAPVKVKRIPLTPQQRAKSIPVSQCLGSVADFLDHMSYLDSSLLHSLHPGRNTHPCTINFPVCAEVKDGMLDEARVEFDRWNWAERERAAEIQAAVEALSFQRCKEEVGEAWDKVQVLEGDLSEETAAELTLPVTPHRECLKFTQDDPYSSKLVQRRREVIENLLSRGVFGMLGNRLAAALDYLPTLRTICKSEQLKEQGKVKRRFLHYLDAIHLGLPKSSVEHLAEDCWGIPHSHSQGLTASNL